MKYQDLIFDLYGTLVDIHTDENDTVWEKTAIYFGFHGAHYSAKELKQAFLRTMAQREAQAGQSYECFPDIPVEHVMAELFRQKGITKNADTLGFHSAQLFRISSMEYIRLYPGVLEALQKLRHAGCRLWLLSNAQRTFTAYELRHIGLDQAFDAIYISSDFGFRKPDTRFFRALLEDHQLNPANCLMIGNDRHTDIEGAKACGLATLYMHTNITPPGQAPADPALSPNLPGRSSQHWEFEGSDWHHLVELITHL